MCKILNFYDDWLMNEIKTLVYRVIFDPYICEFLWRQKYKRYDCLFTQIVCYIVKIMLPS